MGAGRRWSGVDSQYSRARREYFRDQALSASAHRFNTHHLRRGKFRLWIVSEIVLEASLRHQRDWAPEARQRRHLVLS